MNGSRSKGAVNYCLLLQMCMKSLVLIMRSRYERMKTRSAGFELAVYYALGFVVFLWRLMHAGGGGFIVHGPHALYACASCLFVLSSGVLLLRKQSIL